MTPIQLQKYSDNKVGFKRDIVLFKKKANYVQNVSRVELLKEEVPNYKIVSVSKDIDVFFYNPS